MKYRIQSYLILSFCLIISLLNYSCSSEPYQKVDVSDVEMELEFLRFEKDLFALSTPVVDSDLELLEARYSDFFSLYVERIMGFGLATDTRYKLILNDFLTNEDIRELYMHVDSVHKSFQTTEKDLNAAFRYLKYYYPEKPTPKIITFLSGFQYQVVQIDSAVGIGLDMFMGADYIYYGTTEFPQFIIKRLLPEQIPSNVIRAVAKDMYPMRSMDNFTERMIYEGKIMYFLDAMIPFGEDSLKIMYSKDQLEWCEDNEENIWRFFIDKNLLYGNSQLDFAKYFEEAPFTNTISNDSSPKLGVWVGWQIVRKYMRENPELSLQELMENNDYQAILKSSKYRP